MLLQRLEKSGLCNNLFIIISVRWSHYYPQEASQKEVHVMLCFFIQTMYFYNQSNKILRCLSLEPSNADLPPPSLTPFHTSSRCASGFNKEVQSYLCQHLLLWCEHFRLVGKSRGLKSKCSVLGLDPFARAWTSSAVWAIRGDLSSSL